MFACFCTVGRCAVHAMTSSKDMGKGKAPATSPSTKGKGKAPAMAPSSKGRVKTPAPPPSPDMQSGTSDPCYPGQPVLSFPTRRHFLRRRYKELWGRYNEKLVGKKAAASFPWMKVDEESDSSSDGTIPEHWATPKPKASSDRSGDENNTGSRDGKDNGAGHPDPPSDHINFRYGKGSMGSKAGEHSREPEITQRSKEPETTQPSEESQTEESSKVSETTQVSEVADPAESSKESETTQVSEVTNPAESSKESKKTTLREGSRVPRRKTV
ncbi:hypothetical protein QBC34DRAFT_28375 [Podospora aff. communis PSN243]|uniref:Uncharacterized protein n=1 Tax=Podospora aff. communis PSN243 TaxID=3040156 RepID=A0AAV9GWE4_9PEZI|nr:hypothetical protein QBC34DRAFT_28375 [Podospora aff. communis PSN243]